MASAGATKTSAGPLPVRSAAMAVPSADVVLIIGILLVGHVVQTRRVDESHRSGRRLAHLDTTQVGSAGTQRRTEDRKSTRLNSSHVRISYAVFCLKKKKQQ